MKEHTGTFIEIEQSLYKGVKDYCSLNGLKITEFINELLQKAFMREKYGEAPPFLLKKEEMEEIIPSEKENEPEIEEKPSIENIPQEKKIIKTSKGVKKIKTY